MFAAQQKEAKIPYVLSLTELLKLPPSELQQRFPYKATESTAIKLANPAAVEGAGIIASQRVYRKGKELDFIAPTPEELADKIYAEFAGSLALNSAIQWLKISQFTGAVADSSAIVRELNNEAHVRAQIRINSTPLSATKPHYDGIGTFEKFAVNLSPFGPRCLYTDDSNVISRGSYFSEDHGSEVSKVELKDGATFYTFPQDCAALCRGGDLGSVHKADADRTAPKVFAFVTSMSGIKLRNS
jgi:hypothetical protein